MWWLVAVGILGCGAWVTGLCALAGVFSVWWFVGWMVLMVFMMKPVICRLNEEHVWRGARSIHHSHEGRHWDTLEEDWGFWIGV